MTLSLLVFPSLVIVIALLAVKWHSEAARLVELRHQVHLAVGAEAAILQQRLDLIPNSLQLVREAIQVQITYLRHIQSASVQAGGTEGPYAAGPTVAGDLGPLVAAASAAAARPPLDVRSYEAFLAQMERTESAIAAARRFVQASVSEYNAAIAVFPASVVAAFRGFAPLKTREVTPGMDHMPRFQPLSAWEAGHGFYHPPTNNPNHEYEIE